MRERPILSSGEMVRAILDGRKSQTRRVVKLAGDASDFGCANAGRFTEGGGPDLPEWIFWDKEYPDEGTMQFTCPYGQPGDLLWVRETWRGWCPDDMWDVRYRADLRVRHRLACWDEGPDYLGPEEAGCKREAVYWRPSIHMPKWAARTWLEVTGVRVERLQEITWQDAAAEGMPGAPDGGWIAVGEFQKLWNLINTKRGFGWDLNPWVWVVEFKRAER